MRTNEPPGEPAANPSEQRVMRLRYACEGVALGALCGVLLFELGINVLVKFEDILLIPVLAGLCIGLTRRGRVLLRIAAGMLLIAALVAAYSPAVNYLMTGLNRTDVLMPCPAIVILSSNTFRNGDLSAHANDRAMHAYSLLREGFAPLLVMDDATVDHPSQIPGMKRQMEMLGLHYPIVSVGPAADTHDEAVSVARLARHNAWKEVILVTQPWHMRRSAATFEKAGISVVCSPSEESEYDLSALDTPAARLRAFRDWLHEVVGYRIYKQRGWIE